MPYEIYYDPTRETIGKSTLNGAGAALIKIAKKDAYESGLWDDEEAAMQMLQQVEKLVGEGLLEEAAFLMNANGVPVELTEVQQ